MGRLNLLPRRPRACLPDSLAIASGMQIIWLLILVLSSCLCASAQLASRSAKDWIKTLDSSNRVARLKIDQTVARLKIKPGDVVADIGAGSGVFCAPLARAASPGGKVYAVDIDQELIDHIARRAKESSLTNLQTVLGKFTDPNLPARDVDLAFINDTLHHIEDRERYLKDLARYLKPSGRIAIIDFHPEHGPHKDDPSLQVTKEQAVAWMIKLGFKVAEDFDLFKENWFVVFSRPPL